MIYAQKQPKFIKKKHPQLKIAPNPSTSTTPHSTNLFGTPTSTPCESADGLIDPDCSKFSFVRAIPYESIGSFVIYFREGTSGEGSNWRRIASVGGAAGMEVVAVGVFFDRGCC